MKPPSISDMIGNALGSKIQAEYNRLLERDRRSALRYGLRMGMRLRKSVEGEELPDSYVEEIYKNWKECSC